MQHRGMEIVDAHRIFLGFETELIRRTVDCPTFDAAAGHPDTETIVIVIPAHLGFPGPAQLHCRSTTELSAPKNESVLKQPALFQVR
jgi:hypothetical protein